MEPRSLRALALTLVFAGMTASPGVAQAPVGGQNRPTIINASTDPLLDDYRFRSIGPASMGGRIDDIAVSETNPSLIYLGYAVGGVFKSENNGTTWTPVFETYGSASIGDIAIHPTNPDIVYVGTGEPNNRQTSSFGDGMYKTTDGGKTFQHIGLRETQTIARIVIDPRNPEVVYVAVPGHLFGPNRERGIYKTTDGGRTWNNIKFIDENTGFTDIVMDPSNSNTLYAASYQRRRAGYGFNGGGPGSGIWKTDDAGKTWTKISGNGLPPGTYGRIALDVSRSNPSVVYAQVEAGESNTVDRGRGGSQPEVTPVSPVAAGTAPPPGAAGAAGGRAGAAGSAGATGGRAGAAGGADAGGAGAAPVVGGGGGGRGVDPTVAACNTAAPARGGGGGGRGGQQAPLTPDPKLGGVFRSSDKGRTWTFMSNCNSRPMYFSQLRVDASNENLIYVAGLPLAKSLDGGKTFVTLDRAGLGGEPGHVDHHAIWVDPKNPNHIMGGNDGGLSVSYDQGRTWDWINTMATALSYDVAADMRRPYYVYTGLQDNGSWGAPSSTRGTNGIQNSDWFGLCGGDGFYMGVDQVDYNIVYCESQDGATTRYDLKTGAQRSIRPRAPGGGGRGGGGGGGGGGAANVINATSGDQYRFAWNTPFQLSPHNSSIVWLGGNRLFKSYNRGDTYVASADLTKGLDPRNLEIMGVKGDRTMLSKMDGVVHYGTIITLAESPALPGVVWVGTDDGNVQVSRDGGATFTDVSRNLPGLPANHLYWVSRVEASHHDPATAYVSVDGHRSDDLKPYVFVTRDYGKTFTSITNNLPAYGNVQVVREDPKNRDLLFVGTEFGLFASTNGGKEWKPFMNNLPTARVDDILIHPRDGDLIVATHARGIWIADDITPLQQLTPAVTGQDVTLFDVRPAVAWLNDRTRNQSLGGQRGFSGDNAPRGAAISYYLKTPATSDVKITITDVSGQVVTTIDGPRMAGVNRVQWGLTRGNAGGGRGAGGGGGAGGQLPPNFQNMTPAQIDSLRAAFAAQGGGFGGRGGGAGGVQPGMYRVTLAVNGKEYTKTIEVLEDRWMQER